MNGMEAKVVDASALAAVVFDEPKGEMVAGQLKGATLVAPSLLWFELVNICATKLRRYSGQRDLILRAFAMRGGLTIETLEVDYTGTLLLAERTGLTGYDASYLWLAQHLSAELVTLDGELIRAATALGLRT
jgi:predicted nucleic acid-binding protein